MGTKQSLLSKLEYRAKTLGEIPGILGASNYAELCTRAQCIWEYPVGSWQREKIHDAYLAKLYELNERFNWGQPDGFTIKAQTREDGAANSDWQGAWN